MRHKLTLPLLAVTLASPALAQRIPAEANCAPTGMEMHYRCEIVLGPDDAPLEGAEFTISTAMPSMPMAHNMAPVPAEATDTPGMYAATIHFEMMGVWTLTLDMTAPRRDRIVIPVTLEPEG